MTQGNNNVRINVETKAGINNIRRLEAAFKSLGRTAKSAFTGLGAYGRSGAGQDISGKSRPAFSTPTGSPAQQGVWSTPINTAAQSATQAIKSIKPEVMDRALSKAELMQKQVATLGRNSGVSAAQVFKLRMQLENYALASMKGGDSTQRHTTALQTQARQLQELEQRVMSFNSRMVFMEGASHEAQKGIRYTGAAAQGAMLGISAMNGDVMGLAFSLIFLQFAANLPVALGVAAITLGAVLAIKKFKEMRGEQKFLKEMGANFFIVTRSTQAMGLAMEKAQKFTDALGLSSDDKKVADKALVAAQQALRARGIEPTAEAMRIAANAFLISKANNEEYETSLNNTLQSTVAYAETGIAQFGGLQLATEEFDKQGSAALSHIVGNYKLSEESMGALKIRANELGIEIPESLQKIQDEEELTARTTAAFSDEVVADWRDLSKAVNEADVGIETSSSKIYTAMSKIAADTDTHLGKESLTQQVLNNFKAQMGTVATDAETLNTKLQTVLETVNRYAETHGFRAGSAEMKTVDAINVGASMRLAEADALRMGTSPYAQQGTGTTVNINVSGNTVRSDDELADAIASGFSRQANWGTMAHIGIGG